MEIGVVGKPNVGKSTFFNASTLAGAEVASYPFTTVNPNRAMGFVRVACVCREVGVTCNPKNSKCIAKNRFIPVELIDVAGLVPKAHEGRGLGNKFLDELRRASVLIHVVDASGGTDAEGNIMPPGSRDPLEDIRFLEEEIELWFLNIFKRGWNKVSRKVQYEGKDFVKYFEEMYVGIGFEERHILQAVKEAGVNAEKPHSWSSEQLFSFVKSLRQASKPIIIAANKSDVEAAEDNIKRMREELQSTVIPTSSMGEYVLCKLAEEGAIRYLPGDSEFETINFEKISDKQKAALRIIERNVFARFGNTGVQRCINAAIFDVLQKVVVYPVEDEVKFSDKDGNVLPDAFLMDRGATPRDLAFKIHTEIGESFIGAIDARTKRKIASDKPLKSGDIVKILAR
ncbi:MAG: redox-regulated ATPase YchF [Candidatus Hydrothermarchaeota archaeon]|nr:redox-regulated ATPase YchF [Candidatus Hydrothermarchaeota archaeon]